MEKKVLSVSKSSNSAPLVNLIAPEEEFKSQYHYQSPLYRITEDQDVEAFTEFKSGSILFLYVKSLFDFLRNIRDFNDNQEISFWLSNGLANLVLISSDKDALLDLASSLKEAEAINGFEIWGIENNKLNSNNHSVFNEPNSDTIDINFFSFNEELLFIAREFISGISNIIQKSSQFSPSATEHYLKIREKGVKLLEEADRIDKKIKLESSIEAESLYTSYISDLVELNSVISYSLTQGLAGTPPILENPAVIQSYSLLGIGTNYEAYFALYKHVHSVFNQFNIGAILSKKYSKDDGFKLGAGKNNLREQQVNQRNDSSAEHLLYFSGRLGFRESKNAISASLFCISLGATNKWNLLTANSTPKCTTPKLSSLS